VRWIGIGVAVSGLLLAIAGMQRPPLAAAGGVLAFAGAVVTSLGFARHERTVKPLPGEDRDVKTPRR
jgi:hypothetical protein